MQNDSGLWQYFRNVYRADPKWALEVLGDLDSFFVLDISWFDA